MTNSTNEAMREAFESHIRSIEPRTMFLERYANTDAMGDSTGKYAGAYRRHEIESMWIGWLDACKSITVTLTRNHDGQPLLSLSNGQILAMSDIIGMSEAVKLAQDDKKDAIRWRAFRARDTLPALEADDFLDLFEEDADALIDEQLAAKEAS